MNLRKLKINNKLRIKLKKLFLKFPSLYRLIHKTIKKIKRIELNEEGVDGEELKFLLESMGKRGIVVEIGVFTGQTTKKLSENNFVIGIDPFMGDAETGTLLGEYPEDVYLKFIKNAIGKNVLLLPLTSGKAFEFWDKKIKRVIIDSIFIDGLHTYEGVKIDFQWSKYLKKGGIIAFHDTNLKEVEEFLKKNLFENSKYKYLGGKYSTKVFKKIK